MTAQEIHDLIFANGFLATKYELVLKGQEAKIIHFVGTPFHQEHVRTNIWSYVEDGERLIKYNQGMVHDVKEVFSGNDVDTLRVF